MAFVVIPLIAAAASLLTFFSGFGLGTLLTPVFAIFFSVEIAVVLTAVVHFFNGLFKLTLVGKFARKDVLLKFGVPAVISAAAGAWVLGRISEFPAIGSYSIGAKEFFITPVKLSVGTLIAAFTLFEIVPRLRDLEIQPRYLPLGGVLSGFFGGLSGHQGALRSAFLARSGLTKEQFVGTGTVISTLIDTSRIFVYVQMLNAEILRMNSGLLLFTTLAAFLGAFFGNRLLKKMTMRRLQVVVSFSLLFLAAALIAGLI